MKDSEKQSFKNTVTAAVQARPLLSYFLLALVLSIPFYLFGGRKLPLPMNLPVSALM